jgi:hypothetical protein
VFRFSSDGLRFVIALVRGGVATGTTPELLSWQNRFRADAYQEQFKRSKMRFKKTRAVQTCRLNLLRHFANKICHPPSTNTISFCLNNKCAFECCDERADLEGAIKR